MAKVKSPSSSSSVSKSRPAITPEASENQMISLAIDLVKQRLIDGTASSQETTHFLKQATAKYRYELKLLEKQTELAEAKAEQIKSMKRSEELMEEALKAFRNYNGQGDASEY